MSKNSKALQEQIEKAKKESHAGKLDLALRAQYHFQNSGKEVDTTSIEFDEVKQIFPDFYNPLVHNPYFYQ
jgi:hypothetical protein